VGGNIGSQTIGNVDVLVRNVHMGEEALLHETVVVCRMLRCEADVFVEVERGDAAEIEPLGAVLAGERLIEPARGAAGCEAENRVRFFEHLAGDQAGGNLAGFFSGG
jgi:hypothetical protein